ncbi:putative serine/threonine-protein kinase KCC4 [Pseudocercospora fuligena]|uniref:non-specific serine/threonine protein kinase n=1 Tax=Pseudocercospora fuligena TaxID=685502 RepID=A0A8H6RFW0_9PEZI|nr:putative serine/threonine-protein kinase KCC4 [Pseudocercospora fuligena]
MYSINDRRGIDKALTEAERSTLEDDELRLQNLSGEEEAELQELHDSVVLLVDTLPLFVEAVQYRLDNARNNIADLNEDVDEPPMEQFLGVKVRVGRYPPHIYEPALAEFNALRVPPANTLVLSAQGLPGEWLSVFTVGHGAQGNVQIFAQFNSHYTMIGRTVRKDTFAPNLESFNIWSRWYGPPINRIPIEFWTHKLVFAKSRKIIDLAALNPLVDSDRLLYRLYLAYAAHGDLWSFINNYWEAEQPLPKRFVLYVFKALVEAALVFREGDGVRKVVHRDLKPENILLDLPDDASFPNYPEPKVTDFGLAILASEGDRWNPSIFQGCGTPGFLPSEQLSFVNSVTGEPFDDWKILSPSNVWGIGAVLYCMIECDSLTSEDQPSYLPGEKCEHKIDGDFYSQEYGAGLVDLVNQCMSHDPKDRPALDELKTSVADLIDKDLEASQANGGVQDPADTVLITPDNYRIGMTLAQVVGEERAAQLTAASPADAGATYTPT